MASEAGREVRDDFEWTYTQQPHISRRQEMLAKYPQIKELYGPDPKLKWTVLTMVLTQIFMCYLVQDASWFTIFVLGYCFGGIINHSMTLAIHEISHHIAFGVSRPKANKALAIFGNMIVGVPTAITFKRYHIDHHRHLASDDFDVDVPTALEAQLFKYPIGKCIWMSLQPFFYGIRPLLVQPKPITFDEVVNMVVGFSFDVIIILVFGWKSFIYLLGGSLIAMGIHPIAAHFISEHYMFKHGYETYSYYGPLNLITFNVGYHNEHHDFPYIAGSRLPELRKIAPEYYENIPYHTSWLRVLYDFIFDPDISLYCRIKRKSLPRSVNTSKPVIDGINNNNEAKKDN
ncbi:sphingolipid delta(4)-desaturase DES1-like [Watersipora subatra]|uniref:sphingolipid delta(4)-desaturase DES1-like n=1 Tax=Watersipora subatra TaxID=2589382 RepID=UPI00355B15A2